MSDTVEALIQRLPHASDLPLPAYQTPHSAGMDLCAAVTEAVTLAPGGRALVPTGYCIALETGYEAQLRPRSGLALRHGITVLNAPGTVDADYRGEISVLLINHGREAFTINRGDRIAQMVVARVADVAWREELNLPGSVRGQGGFGSTGRAVMPDTVKK